MEYGRVEIRNSSFIGNRSDNIGGAIGTWGSGEISVTNSTFSGNSADEGGAVYSGGAPFTLTQATLAGNYAVQGGAIAIFEANPSRIRMRNSIVVQRQQREQTLSWQGIGGKSGQFDRRQFLRGDG